MISLTAATLALITATASGGPAPADYTRTCGTGGPGPAGGWETSGRDLEVGRIIFIGLAAGADAGPDSHRGPPTAKVPVVMDPGPDIVVRVVPLGRTRARLDFDPSEWRNDRRRGQRSVRFKACRPEGQPEGTPFGYPGGFLIRRGGCARLIVRTPGDMVRRRKVALDVPPERCD